jgi:hypothetical protein
VLVWVAEEKHPVAVDALGDVTTHPVGRSLIVSSREASAGNGAVVVTAGAVVVEAFVVAVDPVESVDPVEAEHPARARPIAAIAAIRVRLT